MMQKLIPKLYYDKLMKISAIDLNYRGALNEKSHF